MTGSITTSHSPAQAGPSDLRTAPRLYVEAPLAADAPVEAAANQAHYLATVMRRGPGDRVRLFNGRDGEWAARIATARRDRLQFHVETLLRPQAPDTDIWLLFALLKRDATDLVVQKATELGVSVLQPVLTARTNAARVNEARLRAIATEAAEQSERLTVPVVNAPRPLSDVLDGWPAERRLFAAIERENGAKPRPACGPAALLVGPEGGFDGRELDGLRNRPFVTRVGLGSLILRAETACLVGLALLQAPECR